VNLVPGVDHGPRIATFIDPQVFWRRPMIGLSLVTPWRLLLPPARGLAPASVVVVVAGLRSRTTASRSAVSLAPALAHALLPDGRHRVLLIQPDPGPLHVKKYLTHIQIVTALEYSRNPGDVGHRSPEALFAYGGKFRVKLAMHRSSALIDPPPPDCAGSAPGPPCLTIGVGFVADVGCDLIFRYSIELNDGEITVVLTFFRHQHLARDELIRARVD
jgi:hypothetical protein